MDVLYLDTSAFLKLYIAEIGSKWIRNLILGRQVCISELIVVEAATSLGRRYREGNYTKQEAARIYALISNQSSGYKIYPLGEDKELKRAATFAFNLPITMRIRALDAIHLAAALSAKQDADAMTPPANFTFVSADRQLLTVATGLGMASENPESHP
jgi:uncharacterized protein